MFVNGGVDFSILGSPNWKKYGLPWDAAVFNCSSDYSTVIEWRISSTCASGDVRRSFSINQHVGYTIEVTLSSITLMFTVTSLTSSSISVTHYLHTCADQWNKNLMWKFIMYTNGVITALSNDNGIITCTNGVWPNTNTICKNNKRLAYINKINDISLFFISG